MHVILINRRKMRKTPVKCHIHANVHEKGFTFLKITFSKKALNIIHTVNYWNIFAYKIDDNKNLSNV